MSEDASPAIGSLAPWFGAKRTMASRIVEELGPHSVYWEPFCGSMAILLAKPAVKKETVNDLHRDLVNLARCIRDPKVGPRLYRRLRRVFCCQQTFLEARSVINSEAPLPLETGVPCEDRAYFYFIASWLGMNGVAGTPTHHTHFARRFSSKGGDAGIRWVGAVRSIPSWRRRLQAVNILSCDGIELCEKIEDEEGIVIYADPPYLVKGARYVHDFADPDHERLATALRRFKRTRVVVSYYDHEKLSGLYPDWEKRSIDVTKNLVNQGRRDLSGVVKAPEVLLVNIPSSSWWGY